MFFLVYYFGLFLLQSSGISSMASSGLECEFYVSPQLPTSFEVKKGLYDAGNVTGDGTSMLCHPQFGQCVALWAFDPETNDTNVLLKGCWKGNGECDRIDCIATENINHRHLNNSRFCCCSSFNCNANFTFVWTQKKTKQFFPDFLPIQTPSSGDENRNLYLVLIFVLLIAILLIFTIIGVLFILQRKKLNKNYGDNLENNVLLASNNNNNNNYDFLNASKEETDLNSCLFSDVDRLILSDVISYGRYSVVRRAYVDENEEENKKRPEYAVKIYQQSNKNYFLNEKNVFQTPFIEYENLVRFHGVADKGGEFWLITEYMPGGTLQDHLKSNTSDFKTMCKLALSVAKGLAYLHSEFKKDGCRKPAIAHRDLNSRNVLMKSDLTCAICDLGFSLALESTKFRRDACEEASLTEVGTIRYMAPEVLEGAVNLRDPETALKQIDVYALGLVVWEIVSRCLDAAGQSCPDYSPPYGRECSVTGHPTLEQMQLLVCKKKARPLFPNLMYKNHSLPLRDLRDMIEDCWDQDCEARITSLCAQERLTELFHSVVVDSNGPRYSFSPNRQESNVLNLNAINASYKGGLLAPHAFMHYPDIQRSLPFYESTAGDTTVTGTTSGLGSMCLNSSDRARSLNSGSFDYHRENNGGITGSEVVPLQPYLGLNPCLERNLHLESSDSSSGYGNRVVESQFDKIDPCTAENFAKFVPNALLAFAKTPQPLNNAGVDLGVEKNERMLQQYCSRPTSDCTLLDADPQQQCSNNLLNSNIEAKEHLLALLLLKNCDDRPSSSTTNPNNHHVLQQIKNNIDHPAEGCYYNSSRNNNTSNINNNPNANVIDTNSDDRETLSPVSEISPGSVSSCDSAFDRRSLSDKLEVPEECTSKMEIDFKTASNSNNNNSNLNRLSIEVINDVAV